MKPTLRKATKDMHDGQHDVVTTPPPGYYREHMPEAHAAIRLARTDRAIVGMVHRPDLADELAAHFADLADEHAPYYAAALRDGRLLPVAYPPADTGRTWAPGELFLRS